LLGHRFLLAAFSQCAINGGLGVPHQVVGVIVDALAISLAEEIPSTRYSEPPHIDPKSNY
jgi:hypothetical protein